MLGEYSLDRDANGFPDVIGGLFLVMMLIYRAMDKCKRWLRSDSDWRVSLT